MDGRVGVVVVTHGRAGEELLRAAQAIAGPLEGVRTVCVEAGEPELAIERRVLAAEQEVGREGGVLFLVDLHGSTPGKVCLALLDGTRRAEVLCGVNLPMLLKLETVDRSAGPHALADALAHTGHAAIRSVSDVTGRKKL